MAIDRNRISSFVNKTDTRRLVYDVIRNTGFEVTYIIEEHERLWGFYLRPNHVITQLFGTRQEVLLWVAEFDGFQSRSVEQAEERLQADPLRLCQDFAIIVVPDPAASLLVNRVAEGLSTAFIGVSLGQISQCMPHGQDSLLLVLQSRLYSKDLYRSSAALTTSDTFYGRRDLVTELSQTLKQGSSNIGIFGLRKCGKTSLLYRLLHQLKEAANVLVAHIDVQRIDSINPSAPYLLWSIGEALLDSNSSLRRFRGFRLFGKHAIYSDVEAASLIELFDHDIRQVLSTTQKRFVLLFDEYELMSPSTPGSQWGSSFVQIWRLLRGLHQQHPGRFAFFVTGTNPRCVELNRIEGVENPVYNYFDVRFLPPLSSPACYQLITELGQRMGLLWDKDAVRRLIGLVGGHPFLLRAYASTIHRSLLPRTKARQVTTADVLNQLDSFLLEFSPHLAQMADVLAEEYGDEYLLLEHLAFGRLGEFREMAATFPEETAHLIGYGLVSKDLNDGGIAIEVLQTWMQKRRKHRSTPLDLTSSSRLAVGDTVAGYRIEASVGTAGGFATVYRAKWAEIIAPKDQDEFVAVKVIERGNLATLQREMDILQEVHHPNIVRFISHGRSDCGHLYLIMEYLSGKTLHEYCNRASRMSSDQVVQVLRRLANALVALHPDEVQVEKLRRKETLTEEQHAELNRSRHGYVHRDIKPQNVIYVEGRGPVLIDFNISAEVYSAVATVSATKGYLPPDGLQQHWTADIDRYQLGLTMLQVAVGVDLNVDGVGQNNINDLRTMAEDELPRQLSDVLLRLTNDKSAWRYPSTSELLGTVNSIRI